MRQESNDLFENSNFQFFLPSTYMKVIENSQATQITVRNLHALSCLSC